MMLIELAIVLNIKMITKIWLDIFVPAPWLIQTKFKPGGDNLTLQKKILSGGESK